MKSKYFKTHELVPEHIYKKYGEQAWRFIDSRLIESIDTLKEHFSTGTMTINNYVWNGDRHWSGLRTPISPWYSETSMHSFGKAIDAVFSDYTAEEVRLYITNNLKFFPHIKGLEKDVSWVHLDIRNEDELVVFSA
jgi:hypothetical protein